MKCKRCERPVKSEEKVVCLKCYHNMMAMIKRLKCDCDVSTKIPNLIKKDKLPKWIIKAIIQRSPESNLTMERISDMWEPVAIESAFWNDVYLWQEGVRKTLPHRNCLATK